MRLGARNLCASVGMAALLTGCLSVEPGIQQAASSGDFSGLNCGQLTNAEGSIRQRLSTLTSGGALFGVTTPQGVPVAERQKFLEGAAKDIGAVRGRRDCAVSTPLVTAAEALQPVEPAVQTETVAAAPASPFAGRYLQVGTFEIGENRDRVLAHFRSRGLNAVASPVRLGGLPHSRVIVGPIAERSDISEIDAAARAIGLNDSFFVTR